MLLHPQRLFAMWSVRVKISKQVVSQEALDERKELLRLIKGQAEVWKKIDEKIHHVAVIRLNHVD